MELKLSDEQIPKVIIQVLREGENKMATIKGWTTDKKDRISYFENEFTRYNRKSIDEVVMFDANIHLECMDDSTFSLIVENRKHRWQLVISSYSGRAKVLASLIESYEAADENP